MRYVVHSYENMYNSLHGIETFSIVEGSMNDAIEVGKEESYSLMTSYSAVYNDLMSLIGEIAIEEEFQRGSMRWEEVEEEVFGDNVAFDIFIVNDTCPYTTREIDSILASNPYDFIADWCKETY